MFGAAREHPVRLAADASRHELALEHADTAGVPPVTFATGHRPRRAADRVAPAVLTDQHSVDGMHGDLVDAPAPLRGGTQAASAVTSSKA